MLVQKRKIIDRNTVKKFSMTEYICWIQDYDGLTGQSAPDDKTIENKSLFYFFTENQIILGPRVTHCSSYHPKLCPTAIPCSALGQCPNQWTLSLMFT